MSAFTRLSGHYLFAITLLFASRPDASAQVSLMDAFLWKQRPLVLFAPSADAPGARGMLGAVQRENAGFVDRDMVLIEVYGGDGALVDGKKLPAGTAWHLRGRFDVAVGEVMVILVGKDGGEKLRANAEIDLEYIFRLVDAMPMRRQQMRPPAASSSAASGK